MAKKLRLFERLRKCRSITSKSKPYFNHQWLISKPRIVRSPRKALGPFFKCRPQLIQSLECLLLLTLSPTFLACLHLPIRVLWNRVVPLDLCHQILSILPHKAPLNRFKSSWVLLASNLSSQALLSLHWNKVLISKRREEPSHLLQIKMLLMPKQLNNNSLLRVLVVPPISSQEPVLCLVEIEELNSQCKKMMKTKTLMRRVSPNRN